jgi:hypothetical protein
MIGRPLALAARLTVCLHGCRQSQLEASIDRSAYILGPKDSTAAVGLTLRNRSGHPLYLQTTDGQADVLIMMRVDVGGREAWTLFRDLERKPLPKMRVVRLDPDSAHHSTFALAQGEYRTLVVFGESPGNLDQHGVWMERFSVRQER